MKVTRARLRTGFVLGLLCSLVSATFLFAGPANAATVRSYLNNYLGGGHYLNASDTTQGPVNTDGYNVWSVQSITPSPTTNDMVYLHMGDTMCLDSHAATNGGAAWVIRCNGGNYQKWEVFYPSNGTRVFKSYGSYTQQRLHLCLSVSGNHAVIMQTCNTANTKQQWWSADAPGQG